MLSPGIPSAHPEKRCLLEFKKIALGTVCALQRQIEINKYSSLIIKSPEECSSCLSEIRKRRTANKKSFHMLEYFLFFFPS